MFDRAKRDSVFDIHHGRYRNFLDAPRCLIAENDVLIEETTEFIAFAVVEAHVDVVVFTVFFIDPRFFAKKRSAQLLSDLACRNAQTPRLASVDIDF